MNGCECNREKCAVLSTIDNWQLTSYDRRLHNLEPCFRVLNKGVFLQEHQRAETSLIDSILERSLTNTSEVVFFDFDF